MVIVINPICGSSPIYTEPEVATNTMVPSFVVSVFMAAPDGETDISW